VTQHRFVFLDGMRGIAAFAVVGLHLGLGFGLKHYPAHGYLAVDFFFCLSGFVLSHAYGARLTAGMAFRDFAWARLARLYPMIFAAGVLAPIAYYGGGFAGPHPPLGQAALLCGAIFLMLPFGLLLHQPAFVLDGPIWSLFFELFANGLFFFQGRRGAGQLGLSLVVLGCFGAALGLTIILVGSAAAIGFSSPASFLDGFARVLYSFSAGVIIHRFVPYETRWRAPAWALTFGLVVVLYSGSGRNSPFYDLLAIIFVLPAMVALGANVAGQGRMSGVWRFLGELSYPVYVIHEPVLRALFRWHSAALAGAGAIAVSYALMVLYDTPVRRWLRKRSLF